MRGRLTSGSELPLRSRAEAAAWLLAIHDPDRTIELENRFRRWLAESEANRSAWERQDEAWELASGLGSRFEARWPECGTRIRPRGRARTALAIAAVLAAAVVAWILAGLIYGQTDLVTTSRGERRVTVLPDGSRVTLNTDTRIVLQYGAGQRRVRLDRGEALFDVRPARGEPFIVVAGAREIRALGTAFEVRRDRGSRVSVTLIEGRIRVALAGRDELSGRAGAPLSGDVTVLASPGQRLTFIPHQAPRIDHAVLQRVLAWQSGEVVFDDTSLSEAVQEMNRYSERQILLEVPGTDSLHVGGLFQAGDSMAFARAVAATFDLEIHDTGSNIVLSRRNAPSP